MKTKPHFILSAPLIQTGDKLLTSISRRRLFALGLSGILFILVCAVSPSPAQAECKGYDVSGQWEIRLDDKEIVQVNVKQGAWQGATASLTGSGQRTAEPDAGFRIDDKGQKGVLSGNITDKSVNILLMVGGAEHRYMGTIGPTGQIEGVCPSGYSPRRWRSSRIMKCDAFAAADAWLEQKKAEKPKAETPKVPGEPTFHFDPNSKKGRGFINGLPSATPTPTPETDESASSKDQHGKHKKNKKKQHRHHHDDNQQAEEDQEQSND